MKTYYLKCKQSKEVINKVTCESMEVAIEYFSKVKDIDSVDLVKIYKVTDSDLK